MSEATLAAALKVINTHSTTPPGIDGDQWADETSAAIVDELDLLKEVQTITASATFDPTKQAVLVNTTAAVTVTLPASLPVGTEARVSRIVASTNAITVVTSGSELIEGVASFAFNLGFAVLVFKKVTATLWLRQIGSGIIESSATKQKFGNGFAINVSATQPTTGQNGDVWFQI